MLKKVLLSFAILTSILIVVFWSSMPAFGYGNTLINKSVNLKNYLFNYDLDLGNLTTPIDIEDKTDLKPLIDQINAILADEIDLYGVYVSTSNSNFITVNGDNFFTPASVSKIPIGVLIFRDIDKGLYDLQKTLPLLDENKAYESDGLWGFTPGSELTIEEYLKRMLQESDNTAMNSLETFLGGNVIVNQRLKDEIGVENFSRDPYIAKPESVGKLLSKLNYGNILSGSSKSKLLSIMSNIPDKFQDRIASGVPKGIQVAHKIGQDVGENGYSYNDAGIVFGEKKTFVIVILNQGVDEDVAITKTRKITELVYSFLNK